MHDLEIIRKIRNEFGHKHQPINFNTEAIQQQVSKLVSHFYEEGEARPRAVFCNTVLSILADIHLAGVTHPAFKEKSNSVAETPENKTKTKAYAKTLAAKTIRSILNKLREENPDKYNEAYIKDLYYEITKEDY